MRVLLKVEAAEAPATATTLFADGKEMGHITRSGFSPVLNSAIAMAYVRREKSAVGSTVQAGEPDDITIATVIAPPLP